ncbi:MAG TPA: energy transducer TonB [Longimicrobium sp.]
MILRFLRPAACALALLAAGEAHAQTRPLPVRALDQNCTVVPDSVRGPTPGQIAERQALRAKLLDIGRRNGVAEPRGLLLVDVDSTRNGALLFLESNYPEPGVKQVTGAVAEYLTSLPSGRRYQALIRVDGEYPAIVAGRQHCTPVLLNYQERGQWIADASSKRPRRNGLSAPAGNQVVVLLVSNREGAVTYATVARSSGDPYLDTAATDIGRKLRFAPATLDGVPFDARFRFTVDFAR